MLNTETRMPRPGATLLVALALIISAPAHAEGRLEGRIADASNKVYFEGAIIRIQELNLETVSRGGGRYTFPSLPAGDYTISVDYVGAQRVTRPVTIVDEQSASLNIAIGQDVDVMDNIIVYGQAAGSARALSRQKAHDGIISILSADAIGQFPDANVSEALQRVPGVYIERDQGEGRFVGVRGLDPDLNRSSINGLSIPAPERDRRSVALDVIPSDLLEGLEVSKSFTPDMDGDAVGGSIDIKGLSAFDREGAACKVSAEGNYSTLTDELGPKASSSCTGILALADGELGIAVSGSYQERDFGSENVETDGGWDFDIEDSGFAGTEEIEQRSYLITRERLGLALNLDYHPDDMNEYYVRTLYSDFSDQEYRQRTELKLSDGDLTGIDDNSATWSGIEMDRELKDRLEEQRIFSLVAGGENQLDDWALEYSYGYSRSEEDEPDRRDTQFSEAEAIISAGYSTVGETPDIFYSADGADPGNFEFNELVVENNFTKDTQHEFKLNITRDTEVGGYNGYIKFGLKYRDRKKTDDVNAITYEDGFTGDPTLADFTVSTLDYGLSDFGPALDRNALNAYIDANIADFEIDADNTLLDSARDYTIKEDVLAGYIMQRVDIDDLRLVYGVRYEDTGFKADGFSAAEDNGEPTVIANSFKNDYSHWLPSITLRYKYRDEVILRAAVSRSISRPSFGFLTPSPDTVEIDETDLEMEAGNPELRPFKSNNFDASVEYYSSAGVDAFSLGVFYKDIDDFIFLADVSDTVDLSQWTGGVDLSAVTDIEVIQALNGKSADLWGIEASWTRRFQSLPAPLNGLLLMVNATYTDSEADLDLGADADRDSIIDLPRQSDLIGNLVLGYEYGPLSLRLAAAYKGRRLLELDLGEADNDLYQNEHVQLDFTARYDVTDNWQLLFDAVNLTDEPFYAYHGGSRFNGQYEEYGPSLRLGLTYRNF